jgi:N-acetylglucosaminyldiphosphoundecaprenol N-acetyl-beta-D-mannosaminyltransferase
MIGEIRLLGIRVTTQRFDEAVERLAEAAAGRVSLRAHFCTVHSLVEATGNHALAEVFESATMVCTDGMPLVWLARRTGVVAERVAGPDTMLALCDRGRSLGLRHYFVGGGDGVAQELANRLSRRFRGLEVAGTNSPPFRAMTASENDDLRRSIVESRANIVWIGLGAPKQDFFAAELQAGVPSVVILPVGAAFDFHAGRVRRAPRWMQRFGLEWLFRLAMEPRRLAGRYVGTNLRFILLVVHDWLRGRRGTTAGR